MNRESTEKLRFDRRLINRPGWISKAELEKNLEALPDVSDKIAPLEEAEEPSKASHAEETVSETAGGQGAALEDVPPWVE
jgi:hypothetical protein